MYRQRTFCHQANTKTKRTKIQWISVVLAKRRDKCAIVLEKLHPMISLVDHQYVALTIHRYASRSLKLPRKHAATSKRTQKLAHRIKHLNSVLCVIRHQHHAKNSVKSDSSPRSCELPIAYALAAECRYRRAVNSEYLHATVSLMHNVHAIVSTVDGNAIRKSKLTSLFAAFAKCRQQRAAYTMHLDTHRFILRDEYLIVLFVPGDAVCKIAT